MAGDHRVHQQSPTRRSAGLGSSLEVLESIETLRGAGPGDLEELVCVLGGILLAASNSAEDAEEGAIMILDSLHDGSAFAKFQQMCIAQGVDATLFESEHALLTGLGLLDASLNSTEVCVSEAGHVSEIDAMERSEERRVGEECRSRWSPYY